MRDIVTVALGILDGARRADWLDLAACDPANAELYFVPEEGTRDGIAEAKRICARCPVRADCLTQALEQDERHGVWGGLDEGELARLRYALARSAA